MNHHTETPEPRQEAAQRLAVVGMLQMHQLRRAMMPRRGGAPWHDPSHGQGRLLALLKLQPETTQKELTFLMGMSRQALAELLTKLERQGLVEREQSATDRRVVVVRLTEAGMAAEQATEHDAGPSDDLLDALDDDEVTQFSAYLGKILEHAEVDDDGPWRGPGFDPRRHGRFGPGGFGPGPFGPGGFRGFPGMPGPGGPGERPGPRGFRSARRSRRSFGFEGGA